jgi:hypothetical protein
MKDANKAIVDLDRGLPRYRYVLVNEEAAREEERKKIKAGL